MQPRIQYARTTDGFSIAFWTMGQGPAFIHTPPPISHIEAEWQFEENRRWYESLAHRRSLVRYDPRGQGLSDRDVDEISLETQILDLQAVVDRIGLQSFDLFGVLWEGPATIAYAARKPESVDNLILWCTSASGRDLSNAAMQATRSLMDLDWKTYTQMVTHVAFGWSAGDTANRFAGVIRDAITPEVLRKTASAVHMADASEDLASVACPTLVLHRREVAYPPMPAVRKLAAETPQAHLTLLEGEGQAPYVGDMDAILRAMDEFLGTAELPSVIPPTASQDPSQTRTGVFRTILFTDIEQSTSLTQRFGDAQAQELLRVHDSIVRGAVERRGGSQIKHTGDGIMASFPAASGGVNAAIEIQQALTERNAANPETPIRVRIGLNAGEPLAEEDAEGRSDLFGTAVILAARIADLAGPGEILVSDVVRQLVAGKRYMFSDRGEQVLRGFEDPVRVYEVRWTGEA